MLYRGMNKWLEIILGIVLLLAPIMVALQVNYVGAATLAVITGGLVIGIALIGLMFVMLGISDITA